MYMAFFSAGTLADESAPESSICSMTLSSEPCTG